MCRAQHRLFIFFLFEVFVDVEIQIDGGCPQHQNEMSDTISSPNEEIIIHLKICELCEMQAATFAN